MTSADMVSPYPGYLVTMQKLCHLTQLLCTSYIQIWYHVIYTQYTLCQNAQNIKHSSHKCQILKMALSVLLFLLICDFVLLLFSMVTNICSFYWLMFFVCFCFLLFFPWCFFFCILLLSFPVRIHVFIHFVEQRTSGARLEHRFLYARIMQKKKEKKKRKEENKRKKSCIIILFAQVLSSSKRKRGLVFQRSILQQSENKKGE